MRWIALLLGAWLCVAGCQRDETPRTSTLLVEFVTSLEGRTPGQRHNTLLAAKRVDGAILPPKTTWSFNQTVGPWVRSEGYVRAPVSYGGILVPAWGGGVCQTATTLYNAALLAGLEIVERHPHALAPSYIGVGRDAAVAQGIADLKLRNPYPFPCRVEFKEIGARLVCRIYAQAPAHTVRRTVPRCTVMPEIVDSAPAPIAVGFRTQPGRAGVRVRLWRTCALNGESWRECCHETQYAPLPRGIKTR